MGYDQVLVLDQGRLMEKGWLETFGKKDTSANISSPGAPYELLSSGGIFESMASAAGLKTGRSA